MQKQFFSLRLIASVINLLSWCLLILAFLEAFFLMALSAGVEDIDSREVPKLYFFIKGLNAYIGLNTIFILITGLISFVLLNSVSERIRLFIQIEENTRLINQNLGKITKLLESKFQIEAEDVDEKISIIDKIIYWGQIIPIAISILFFLSIIKQLPRGINQHKTGVQEIIPNQLPPKHQLPPKQQLSPKHQLPPLMKIWEGHNFNSVFKQTSKTDWIENSNSRIYYYTHIPVVRLPETHYLLKDKNREGVLICLTPDKVYYKDNNSSEWLCLGNGHFKNTKSDRVVMPW